MSGRDYPQFNVAPEILYGIYHIKKLVKVPNIVKLPYFEINGTTKKTFKHIDEIEMLRSQDIEVEIHLQKQQLQVHGIPDISV